jgi:hypothetical protein
MAGRLSSGQGYVRIMPVIRFTACRRVNFRSDMTCAIEHVLTVKTALLANSLLNFPVRCHLPHLC